CIRDRTGLDGSAENIEKAHKLAARKSLAIDFQTLDPRHFKFHRNRYALIVSDHCFDHLSKADLRELAPKISGSLRKGGLLIGAGLTIDDLSCRELLRKRAELIEKYCFRLPNGWIYSYFDYREPLDLFPDLRVLHYSENNLCETSGGRSAWRSIVEFAFRKS
ncbi:MAG: class I SAM-dependent methyltransferase, partial [Acidobacteriota bacterium]|nr:class I SAM-dependent methyltransferase [Acidobacteriota bacterium]